MGPGVVKEFFVFLIIRGVLLPRSPSFSFLMGSMTVIVKKLMDYLDFLYSMCVKSLID